MGQISSPRGDFRKRWCQQASVLMGWQYSGRKSGEPRISEKNDEQKKVDSKGKNCIATRVGCFPVRDF